MTGEYQQKAENTGDVVKSLAILPFRFLRPEKEDDKASLSVGLADALAAKLYDVQGLAIRPANSVLQLSKQISDPFELGQKLGVDYVLDGHILPVGERIRFSVQLLNISERNVFWAAQFDESEADIFQLEDLISARIVESLVPQFNPTTGKQKEKTPSVEPDTLPLPPAEITQSDEIEEETANSKNWRWAIVGVIVLLIGLGAFWAYQATRTTIKIVTLQKTIAILPFRSENELSSTLGTGLSEALTSKLGTIRAFSVRPASAGRGLLNAGKDAATIGREIGANYVVRGTMNSVGELRARVDIVNAATGETVWTENFVEPTQNLSNLQVKIAEGVVKFFKIQLSTPEREQLFKRYTENNLAYELYLVGRFQMADRSVENLSKAINTFNQAIEKDSNFALAYAGLADAHRLVGLYQVPAPLDATAQAKKNALQALSLDDTLGETHATLGEIKLIERDRPAAEQEYRRAIELNPSYASAHHWYALALSSMGRHEEALKEIKIAQGLDPYSPIIDAAAGMVYFFDRRYTEALAECEKALQKNPAFLPAHRVSRWIHQMTGNYDAALASYKKERNFSGDVNENDPGWMMTRGAVEAVGGRREEAIKLIERSLTYGMVKNNPKAFAYGIAEAYAFAGDKENALLWLEKAEVSQNRAFVYAQVDPIFLEKFGNDPRYLAIIKKLQTPLE